MHSIRKEQIYAAFNRANALADYSNDYDKIHESKKQIVLANESHEKTWQSKS